MTTFIIKRLGWMAITLWVVFTVSFFLMRAVPGGPLSRERQLDPQIEANLQSRYHLDEPFFIGHFPGRPIMPAVLIIEAMAQVGGILLLSSVDKPEKYLVYFIGIDKAKFRKPVVPGDQIRFELEMLSLKKRFCKMKGVAYVDDKIVAEAELTSTIVNR